MFYWFMQSFEVFFHNCVYNFIYERMYDNIVTFRHVLQWVERDTGDVGVGKDLDGYGKLPTRP